MFSVTLFGQKTEKSQNRELLESLTRLSSQQLFDTATYYYKNIIYDTALICFNLIINHPPSDDLQQNINIIKAQNMAGVAYSSMSDYKNAYNMLMDALTLSEKHNIESELSNIFIDIGNVYYYIAKYDVAEIYYHKALRILDDSLQYQKIYNNLGVIKTKSQNYDSAFYFYNKTMQLRKDLNKSILSSTLNNIATYYHLTKQYDSAYYYYNVSLQRARVEKNPILESLISSNLCEFFFEKDNKDSAIYYYDLSNSIAFEKRIFTHIAQNYLNLSIYEESKGNTKKSFEYHKKHKNIIDSLFNINIYTDINNLQRQYEVAKTNQEIEQLMVEQRIKEQTIRYKNIILYITLAVLFLVTFVLVIIYLQKRKINKSYKLLFDKNVENIELQGKNPESSKEKYKKFIIPDNKKSELLDKILTVMEDKNNFCNPKFSLIDLSKLVDYSHKYVSEIIKNSLDKNFSLFLNEFRIKEAQRLFSSHDAAKYTIEYVSKESGFQSRNTFNEAFKNIVGVSPKYYIKSLQEHKDKDKIANKYLNYTEMSV